MRLEKMYRLRQQLVPEQLVHELICLISQLSDAIRLIRLIHSSLRVDLSS